MTIELGAHVAITSPDSRGRFTLKKWIFGGPVAHWRVHRSADGKTITLQAIEEGAP